MRHRIFLRGIQAPEIKLKTGHSIIGHPGQTLPQSPNFLPLPQGPHREPLGAVHRNLADAGVPRQIDAIGAQQILRARANEETASPNGLTFAGQHSGTRSRNHECLETCSHHRTGQTSAGT